MFRENTINELEPLFFFVGTKKKRSCHLKVESKFGLIFQGQPTRNSLRRTFPRRSLCLQRRQRSGKSSDQRSRPSRTGRRSNFPISCLNIFKLMYVQHM